MKLKPSLVKLNESKRLYNLKSPIIALTGGIATGKSTVSKILNSLGLPIIDADKNVKAVYASEEGFNFVKNNFSNAIEDSHINFQKLRNIAFENDQNRELIESFIYSKLPEQFLKAFEELGQPSFVIYDVPLLFEKKLDKLVDIKITVYTDKKTQFERIKSRDNSDDKVIKSILSAQIDIDKKKEMSDFIIDNTSTIERLEKNIEELLSKLFDN